MVKPPILDGELEHEWHVGPPGIGKSRSVSVANPGAYLKSAGTKWWDGYTDQEVVIIEDFDAYNVAMSQNLKIWADRYPFIAEMKNGASYIRPKKIIVTSNYLPTEIWTTDRMCCEAMERRFIIHEYKWAPGHGPPARKRNRKEHVVTQKDQSFFTRLATDPSFSDEEITET